jgi:purine-binding chemotaxis protein CheW
MTTLLVGDAADVVNEGSAREAYVTATIADQLFGIPIGRVQDVFNLGALTPVPLAPADIVGLANLRGRVVTAIDIRSRLGHARKRVETGAMAIGIEAGSDAFGLVVDRIGEIISVDRATLEDNPVHLDPSWAGLSRGVHRLESDLLVVLDVDAMLETSSPPIDLSRASESPQ